MAAKDPHHRQVIARLREKVDHIPFEKASLISFKGKRIMDRAFFPGGNGLFEGETAVGFPFGGTLILGSNFGCSAKYDRSDGSLLKRDETSNETWTPLRDLLEEAGVDKRNCFFTNAWPCLHEGKSNKAHHLIPGWLRNVELMRDCTDFFAEVCAEMEPSLILALGPGPAKFLFTIWKQELSAWKANKIKGMDILPIGIVQIPSMGHQTVCTAVVHPCYQNRNSKLRKPPYQHPEGEVQLLKEADARRKAISQHL